MRSSARMISIESDMEGGNNVRKTDQDVLEAGGEGDRCSYCSVCGYA